MELLWSLFYPSIFMVHFSFNVVIEINSLLFIGGMFMKMITLMAECGALRNVRQMKFAG